MNPVTTYFLVLFSSQLNPHLFHSFPFSCLQTLCLPNTLWTLSRYKWNALCRITTLPLSLAYTLWQCVLHVQVSTNRVVTTICQAFRRTAKQRPNSQSHPYCPFQQRCWTREPIFHIHGHCIAEQFRHCPASLVKFHFSCRPFPNSSSLRFLISLKPHHFYLHTSRAGKMQCLHSDILELSFSFTFYGSFIWPILFFFSMQNV